MSLTLRAMSNSFCFPNAAGALPTMNRRVVTPPARRTRFLDSDVERFVIVTGDIAPGPCNQLPCALHGFDASQDQTFLDDLAERTPPAGGCCFQRLMDGVVQRNGQSAHN